MDEEKGLAAGSAMRDRKFWVYLNCIVSCCSFMMTAILESMIGYRSKGHTVGTDVSPSFPMTLEGR